VKDRFRLIAKDIGGIKTQGFQTHYPVGLSRIRNLALGQGEGGNMGEPLHYFLSNTGEEGSSESRERD
jgi:hypothetical protein